MRNRLHLRRQTGRRRLPSGYSIPKHLSAGGGSTEEKFPGYDPGIAYDYSGNDNHGVLSGAIGLVSDAVFGTSVGFKDASALVTVPHDERLEPAKGTIGLWIKVPELHNADVVSKITFCLVRREPNCSVGIGRSVIGLRITQSGRVHAFIANDDPNAPGPWTFAISSNRIKPNTWHHLAMRWDGSNLYLFIDGRQRAATSYDPVPGAGLSYSNGTPLYFGTATSWGFEPGDKEFIGLIDDVRYYADARKDGQIFADWKARAQELTGPGL